MAKVVEVTSAQVRAAQTVARRAEERGEEVPASIRRIADAVRKQSPEAPGPGDSNAVEVKPARYLIRPEHLERTLREIRARLDPGTDDMPIIDEAPARQIVYKWLTTYSGPRRSIGDIYGENYRYFPTGPGFFPNQPIFSLTHGHEPGSPRTEYVLVVALDDESRELSTLKLMYDPTSRQFDEPRIAISTPGGWVEISAESLSGIERE